MECKSALQVPFSLRDAQGVYGVPTFARFVTDRRCPLTFPSL
jgi:hypothetical protein